MLVRFGTGVRVSHNTWSAAGAHLVGLASVALFDAGLMAPWGMAATTRDVARLSGRCHRDGSSVASSTKLDVRSKRGISPVRVAPAIHDS
jgi:hypothetical protein